MVQADHRDSWNNKLKRAVEAANLHKPRNKYQDTKSRTGITKDNDQTTREADKQT